MAKITVVGLGPGSLGLITLETWDKITKAKHLILRTANHPTTKDLKKNNISFRSYDQVYEEKNTFEEVYGFIAKDVMQTAKTLGEVVYAVPGSPLVAERTVVLLRKMAEEEGITLDIIAGMSFMEVLYVRLGVDPIEGVTILDSSDLQDLPQMPTALVVTQLYSRQVASEVKLALMEAYPDDYSVTLVRNLGLPDEEIKRLPLYELDRQEGIDHLTSLYVPKMAARQARFDLDPLVGIMATLRSPGGCVWDMEQTHRSLRQNLIEEVYEVIEAIDLADLHLLCEELGDLLLQVVFHARMAEEAGAFSMQDVIDGIVAKLIRRHPHVFGDVTARDAAEVVLNWEKIKKQEKTERQSALDGVPKDMPGLMRAYKLQQKAAKVGFDWDNISAVWDKIREEIAELKEAVEKGGAEEIEEELGDCLFSFVNLSRFLKVNAEVALNGTNAKFVRRFSFVEETLKKQNKAWEETGLKELNLLWDSAKRLKI